jgi:TRAP-type C4-dicarboxylate transport system substrate-binding protein
VWQKIPPEDQEIFLEAAKKLQTFKNDYYARENPKMIDELKSKGMEVNEVSAQFKEQFAALMQEKVYPEFYDEIGGGDAAKGREIVEEIIRLGNE